MEILACTALRMSWYRATPISGLRDAWKGKTTDLTTETPSVIPPNLVEGTMVRFEAPNLAYSPSSKQSHYNGQIGQLYQYFSDSYCYVLFGPDLLLLNSNYLHLHDPAPTLLGQDMARNYPRPRGSGIDRYKKN